MFFWKQLPDRDAALERVYDFIKAVKAHDLKTAASLVMVRDMGEFIDAFHNALHLYLNSIIEDEQWNDYEGRNLSFEIEDPGYFDETLTQPEFSGKHFDLGLNESISIKVGLLKEVTPVRLHFTLAEEDELYYLRLNKITA